MIKRGLFVVAALLAFVTAGCRGGLLGNIGGQSIIDWADFLKLNGISYTAAMNMALTDPARIGEAIGEVRFKVSGNVHDGGYKEKDGDAAFLDKGTAVYAIDGYPRRDVVAVKDAAGYNGYKLYAANGTVGELMQTIEQKGKETPVKVGIDRMYGSSGSVARLEGARAGAFVSVLYRGERQDNFEPSRLYGDPQAFRVVIDGGDAVGFMNLVYNDGFRYYWHESGMRVLPSEIAYYFAGERDVVFRVDGMAFMAPGSAVTLANGDRIKRTGSADNITIEAKDGRDDRDLFNAAEVAKLWQRIRDEKPGGGEAKTILYWATRPTPVQDGRAIAFESNKDTVLAKRTTFRIHVVNIDGSGERVLVNDAKIGYPILLDSVGDRLVASAEADRSLLDINVATGAIRQYPVNGHLDALSKDGRYVLYRKMASDVAVGTELWAIDLETGTSKPLGEVPQDYIFNKMIK